LNEHGWRLQTSAGVVTGPARASESPAALGIQDLVIVTVKGPALADVARRVGPLLGPDTLVLPAMNGVPWWFCEGLPGAAAGRSLASVDPEGAIAAGIPLDHVIGCVVHAAAYVSEPGVARHNMGQGLIVGEPRGGVSERVAKLKSVLDDAGFDTTVSDRIQRDIFYKLWGNMTTNPISAITGATTDRIVGDDVVRELMTQAMLEAARVGERMGCAISQTPAERQVITRSLGAFRTSMLQDVEAGRSIELDSLVGAVRELGRLVDVATPTIDAIFGLTRLFGRVHGLYPEAPESGGGAAA
jgi:2-dehydropantoate 2-reductase